MTQNQNVEIVSSLADRIKIVLGIVAVVAGLAGFYLLAGQPMVVRVLSVLGGLIAGSLIAWFSVPGQRLFAFGKDSWSETRRVVWPTRKETVQMTLTVFVFVVVMAIFLWLIDKTLEWVLYDLLLGWKR
jgi:preprotein translocase subunit SecE